MIDFCPCGHPLTWLSDRVAICPPGTTCDGVWVLAAGHLHLHLDQVARHLALVLGSTAQTVREPVAV